MREDAIVYAISKMTKYGQFFNRKRYLFFLEFDPLFLIRLETTINTIVFETLFRWSSMAHNWRCNWCSGGGDYHHYSRGLVGAKQEKVQKKGY